MLGADRRGGYVVYLASFTWPPENVGGPGAVLRLLSRAIHERGGCLDAAGVSVPVKALFGDALFDLRCANPAAGARPRAPVAGRARVALGQAVNAVKSRTLNRVSRLVWSRALTGRIVELIGSDAGGRIPVIIAFGPPLIYRLSQYKERLNAIFVHTEHSKGGSAREAITHRDRPAGAGELSELRKVDERTIERSDRLGFPSVAAKELFQESYPVEAERIEAKAFILYNAVEDLSGAPVEAASPRVVLNIASHVPEKQIELALRGFGRFLEEDPTRAARYRFVNAGPRSAHSQNLERLSQKLGLAESVEFHGAIERGALFGLLRMAWVCVSTPSRAVFDLSLLEAMSIGRPVVATGVGGNIEALGVDYPHYVVNADDFARELGALTDGETAARAVRRNRNRFLARFTLDRQIDALSELVEDVTGIRKAFRASSAGAT
jgi:glycosyltransferase involved in cell wall biosynthesis